MLEGRWPVVVRTWYRHPAHFKGPCRQHVAAGRPYVRSDTMAFPPPSPAMPGFGRPPPAPALPSWPRSPRRLAAGRGVEWWKEGWRIFTASPLVWILIVLAWIVGMVVVGFVPLLGNVVQTVLWPVLAAGVTLGCHAMAGGKPLEFAHLFAGFKSPRLRNLLTLGLIALAFSIAITLIVLLAMMLSFGTAGLAALMSGDSMAAMTTALGAGMVMLLLLPILLIVIALFTMAWWFAVPLVTLNGAPPVEALKASYAAAWANIGALAVFGLVFIVLAIVASIPMGLGWLVLMPVAIGAGYASWREVFGA